MLKIRKKNHFVGHCKRNWWSYALFERELSVFLHFVYKYRADDLLVTRNEIVSSYSYMYYWRSNMIISWAHDFDFMLYEWWSVFSILWFVINKCVCQWEYSCCFFKVKINNLHIKDGAYYVCAFLEIKVYTCNL